MAYDGSVKDAVPFMSYMNRARTVEQALVEETDSNFGFDKMYTPVSFFKANLASDSTFQQGLTTFIPLAGCAGGEGNGYYSPKAGSVVSCAVQIDAALTSDAGITVVPGYVTANGTWTSLNGTVSLLASDDIRSYTNYSGGTKQFAAGTRVGISVATQTSNPATDDIFVTLGLSF